MRSARSQFSSIGFACPETFWIELNLGLNDESEVLPFPSFVVQVKQPAIPCVLIHMQWVSLAVPQESRGHFHLLK